ncbi:MAG: hypothetical protein DLM71_03125 [Chloroflexi bacterium]|nr:MAG: hypothetical protein DLM71_03125 [Chloroflexota bacterium]
MGLLGSDGGQPRLDRIDPGLSRLRPQPTLLEGNQVALQAALEVDPLNRQGRVPAAPCVMLTPPLPIRLIDRPTQQSGVGVHLGELTEHRRLELIAAQAVLVAGCAAVP